MRAQPARVGKVVCSAQEDNKQLSTALAAAALAAVVGFGQVDAAKADIAGLTPCSESKAYQKRLKNELKTLTKRAKQVRMQAIAVRPRPVVDTARERLQRIEADQLMDMLSDLQYDPESAPALALKATADRTEKRFANYAKAGLLCGADGLPHLISDPGLALKYGHAGETFVSTCVQQHATTAGRPQIS